MQEWRQRPPEVANLFNPAFCAVLLAKTVDAYSSTRGQGLPFELVFLVLPIVLHERTRSTLPRTITTPLLAWIETNQAELVGFPERARRLVPVTREAVMFGLAHEVMRMEDDATVSLGEAGIISTPSALRSLSVDVQECFKKSYFLGRWLAGAGTSATIMASWGVAP
jgi:hypothetical protein